MSQWQNLITVISKLQDVFATVGRGDELVQLPQIVVIGSQSAGKSSVIEGIVGRDFLPRGTEVVTRRPLLLHLHNVPLNDERRSVDERCANGDWATFNHLPHEIFTDFEKVRDEIHKDTEKLVGNTKNISAEKIILHINSEDAIDLSLVDLPGTTKVPVGDQPEDIEHIIEDMILDYIKHTNSIILAVTPANTDFATSEAVKLANKVDKDGLRTLCVLTKLDLMDQGTNAMNVLQGKTKEIKLGIIGVVMRSQADIISKKSMKDCLKDEEKFLRKKYLTIAERNGIKHLTQTLNYILMNHIRDCLPDLKLQIQEATEEYELKLEYYGDPDTDDKREIILEIISKFSNSYTSMIDGTSRNINTSEVCGGAHICSIFHDEFYRIVEDTDPFKDLTDEEIYTAIRNASGVRPPLFVPEPSFDILVKRQIRSLEKPCKECVQKVYEELLQITKACSKEIEKEMERFPRLFQHISEAVSDFLKTRINPTKEFVKNLVEIEVAYINTENEDFKNPEFLNWLSNIGRVTKSTEFKDFFQTKMISPFEFKNPTSAKPARNRKETSFFSTNYFFSPQKRSPPKNTLFSSTKIKVKYLGF